MRWKWSSQVNYDDEILIAYAEGQLDEAMRAEIATAICRDPALARRVEEHRTLRADAADDFATASKQPVAERIGARGNVVHFPSRAAHVPSAPWRAREWLAMAASLVLGILVSWKFLAPGDVELVAVRDGTMVARGALARALDRQLAGAQTGAEPVLIGFTFKTPEGHFCRSFNARGAATAGLACRTAGEWRIPVIDVAPPLGGLRQEATPPPVVLQAIEARIVGEPLDAAGEQRARDAAWDGSPP